jgi:hypothetical protein
MIPDAHEIGMNVATHATGEGREHVALLVHQTALTRCSGKSLSNRS